MSWDFSTDADFQAQLDWMSEFVRAEIWPLEAICTSLGWRACQRRSRRCRSRSVGYGPCTCRPVAARAWVRFASG